MASLNISLPAELKGYVEAQVKGGSFGNVSEFFRSLIREHQERAIQSRLDRLLMEGLESGGAGPMTRSDWIELRRLAVERAQARGSASRARKSKSSKNPTSTSRSGRNRGVLRRGVD